jgi:hypothetical protein
MLSERVGHELRPQFEHQKRILDGQSKEIEEHRIEMFDWTDKIEFLRRETGRQQREFNEQRSEWAEKFESQQREIEKQRREWFERQVAAMSALAQTFQGKDAEEKKKEIFYQEWLAKAIGGRHKIVPSGITDLSTDVFDVEIKKCSNWNIGVRQVFSYNHHTQVPNRILALFDAPDGWIPSTKCIEACDDMKVRLILLRSDKHYMNVHPPMEKGLVWSGDMAELRGLVNSVQSTDCDPYQEFCNEHLVEAPGMYLLWTELLLKFKVWYRASFGKDLSIGHAAKDIKDIKTYFADKLGADFVRRTRQRQSLNAGIYNWRVR